MDNKVNLTVKLAISLSLVGLVTSVTAGKIIYVDANATGSNDGSSWQDAYNFLQDALADADSSQKPVEIRVAQGVYKPDQGANQIPGDREATFQLINGVTLKGGYVGFGAPDADHRRVDVYETILSGDLNGDDSQTWPSNRDENTYHVVTGSGTNTTAALDGFTITGGNATNEEFPWSDLFVSGGGIYNDSNGSPTLTNCTFSKNRADFSGGGMYNKGSSPTLIKCAFVANEALVAGGMLNERASPTVVICTFRWNQALIGGGMYNRESNPTVTNSMFSANKAAGYGGGMYNKGSSPTLVNCIFSGNSTTTYPASEYFGGGGIYNDDHSNLTLTNCTFVGNSGQNGNGIRCYSSTLPSNLQLTNCILWDPGKEISNDDGSVIKISYSDVKGGWPGEGNIDVDPRFAGLGYWDPNGTPADPGDDFWVDGDYRLKSQAGRYDPNSSSWITDDVTSPCIDAGDPKAPIGLEPFPNGGVINMGAYGGTAEGSKSYLGEPVCETIVAGDINGDCKVDLKDLMILAYHWLEER